MFGQVSSIRVLKSVETIGKTNESWLMNTSQFSLLQDHNLTVDMIFKVSTLVDGKKQRFYNRSYKALCRRDCRRKISLRASEHSSEKSSTLGDFDKQIEKILACSQDFPQELRKLIVDAVSKIPDRPQTQ